MKAIIKKEKINTEIENDNKNKEDNYIKELIPQILEKGVEILNDTGNKKQFFKKKLKQMGNSLLKDENIKDIKNNPNEEVNCIKKN